MPQKQKREAGNAGKSGKCHVFVGNVGNARNLRKSSSPVIASCRLRRIRSNPSGNLTSPRHGRFRFGSSCWAVTNVRGPAGYGRELCLREFARDNSRVDFPEAAAPGNQVRISGSLARANR